MKPACLNCGHIHTSTDTYVVSRFANPVGGFRARFAGSPLRATRRLAEADMCRHRQGPADPRDPLPGQEALL